MRTGRQGLVAWAVRLALLSAVLFGVVTMHSFGHPTEHSPPSDFASSAGQALDAHADHAAHLSPGTSDDLPAAGGPAAGWTLDPLSVCLAVLVAWAAALLTAECRARRATDRLGAVRTRLLRALWPVPPPGGRILLARLSVLRL
ncbi:hypothetical protein [Streptomyces megasporus]|uniref:hypothetical protein n=1 Tax=Streptomyces megasporus TaxID=44060 RepID=UPI000995FCAB|nr:hypothetical protein [Streptomyces megasporus]